MTTPVAATIPADTVYRQNLADIDGIDTTEWVVVSVIIAAAPAAETGRIAIDFANLMEVLYYDPQDFHDADAEFSIIGGRVSDPHGTSNRLNFRITVMPRPVPPAPPPSATVARKKDSDDDVKNLATAVFVGAAATYIYGIYQTRNPKFNKVNFTAMPTSNKSLQYNLSTNINKNWSANFTVDKQVKINSDTTNSNHYKLEFKYRF